MAGAAHIVRLSGELDMASSPELEAVVRRISEDASQIVLDLEGVSFMDSTGLVAILTCKELCARSACGFLLTAGNPQIERVCELAGVLDSLPFAQPGPPI